MLDYFNQHHDQLFYLLSGLGLVVELAIMGLSGPLLFFAIGSFITGLLISAGVINGWELEIFTLGISSAVAAALLWRPLKQFQNSGGGSDTSSDMIGRQVVCCGRITATGGAIRYSGIDWPARLNTANDATIELDGLCVIQAVDGNVMLVAPV